jgi:RNA polymerase sigma factor (sigma-70 family)
VSVFADLRRRRADSIIRRDYEGLRRVVMSSVRGQLARKGVQLPDADLDAAYNVAWQGLYAQLLEGDEIKNLAGFLVTVTARRAIDEYRKLHVARRAEDVEVGDHGRDPDFAERLDDYTKLQHFIEGLKDRLDQRERQAVTLCYIQGLSRREAAQILGLSDKRMDKVMDGLASRIGDFVRAIESGLWCEERGSLMRAYALHILAPDGKRQVLAREHLAACSGCRAYVRSLRGLAAAMPPVALPAGGGSTGSAGFLDHLQSLIDGTRDTLASLVHLGPAEAIVGGGGTAGVGTAAAVGSGSGGTVAAAGGTGAAVGTTGVAAGGTAAAAGGVAGLAAAGAGAGSAAGGVLGGGLAAKAAALAVSVAVAGGATATVTHHRPKAAPQRPVAQRSFAPATPTQPIAGRPTSRIAPSQPRAAAPQSVGRTAVKRPTQRRTASRPADEFGFEAAQTSTPSSATAGTRATEFGFERTDATPAATRASTSSATTRSSDATAARPVTSASTTTTPTPSARTPPVPARTSTPSASQASNEFGFER